MVAEATIQGIFQMLLHVFLLLVLSYTIFVFVSDLFNPFVKVRAPLKLRFWKAGRASAICSLVAGVVALFLIHVFGVSERLGLSFYLVFALMLNMPIYIKHHKSAIWR